jgi:hypothetical protein
MKIIFFILILFAAGCTTVNVKDVTIILQIQADNE